MENPEKPKMPFYDEKGRVNDRHIAQKMAQSEDFHRDIGESASTAERSAEITGEETYDSEGSEIPEENVPPNVRAALNKLFQEAKEKNPERYADMILGSEQVHFRLVERGDEAKQRWQAPTLYVMDIRWKLKSEAGKWMGEQWSVDPNGQIRNYNTRFPDHPYF